MVRILSTVLYTTSHRQVQALTYVELHIVILQNRLRSGSLALSLDAYFTCVKRSFSASDIEGWVKIVSRNTV